MTTETNVLDEKKYTLIEHLRELRTRVLHSLLALIICTGLTAYFVSDIFVFLVQPIMPYLPEPKQLMVTSPIEQVVAYLKIAVVSGLFLALPAVLYQVWKFISPGLYAHEKRLVVPFIFFGTAFFVGGAAFGYFVFLPKTFQFLMELLPKEVKAEFTVEKYYGLITHLLLGFGLIFELPLILAMLSLLGIVSSVGLRKYRRYAVLGAFVISAFITPTVDPYSQTLMAAPIVLFYEVGIWFAWLVDRKRTKAQPVA